MPDISFLDHAWGKTPPSAQVAGIERLYGLYTLGNMMWDILFMEVMPTAAAHVKQLLNVGDDRVVEFCHNSHEILTRLLSTKMDSLLTIPANDHTPQIMRVLTTDTEFYSLTRQLNRFKERGERSQIQIESVEIEPLETFPARFAAKAGQNCFDIVYASQCVYSTQETIVPDVTTFVASVHENMREAWTLRRPTADFDALICLDGYHGFGAIPTDLSAIDSSIPLCYISGMLKHVGSGANCAFMVCPTQLSLRPMLTGWLADPSVLAPESNGLVLGSKVGYCPGLSLQGGTPAFTPSLLIFNEVMSRWQEGGITVARVHDHVMDLHDLFIAGLKEQQRRQKQQQDDDIGIKLTLLHSLLPRESRSHTLVFDQPSAAYAKMVVETLRQNHGIEIDSRKQHVRIGFGYNHDPEDIDRLLRAIA